MYVDTHSKELTKVQANVFQFVVDTIETTGSAPTLQEIADFFDYKSINAVVQHLKLIEQKGRIELLPGKARGIRIVNNSLLSKTNSLSLDEGIPILGSIAAGRPALAFLEANRYLPVAKKPFGRGDLFALEVAGDSMIDAGIFNKDFAIIRRQPDVESGEIAAILIDDEATLKRLIKKDDAVVLRAENAAYSDIEIISSESGSLSVAGLMVGLIRGISPMERNDAA